MLGSLVFSVWLANQPLTREPVIGAGFVLAGLACMGGDSLLHGEGGLTLAGSALFAAAGLCWGMFGALVPGAASVLAIPVLGKVPTLLQVAGIAAVVAGLLLAFGAARYLIARPERGAP